MCLIFKDMEKQELYNWYNATSTEHPIGSDEIEIYEHWLERQLISRIERLKALEQVSGDDAKKSNCNNVIASFFADWLTPSKHFYF
jgi:hypothetical protein